MDDLPEDGERKPLVRASFLPLIHHHRYSTMRGYQYPLTDTDVGQLAASDRERFHLGCRASASRNRECKTTQGRCRLKPDAGESDCRLLVLFLRPIYRDISSTIGENNIFFLLTV